MSFCSLGSMLSSHQPQNPQNTNDGIRYAVLLGVTDGTVVRPHCGQSAVLSSEGISHLIHRPEQAPRQDPLRFALRQLVCPFPGSSGGLQGLGVACDNGVQQLLRR